MRSVRAESVRADAPAPPAVANGGVLDSLRKLAGIPLRKAPSVGATPHEVVFSENKWRLLRYTSAQRRFVTPILLVPSLINRHYVLDLMPGKSFAEWLVSRGHDVFVIDWGTPGPEDRWLTFDDVCDKYLGRALRRTAKIAGSGPPHVLGYCLGGTLAAIHGAARPESMASLVALAAPVRFKDSGILAAWTNTKSFDVDALCDANSLVPWQLLQGAFHLLRPTLGLMKAVQLLDRAWNDEFLDGFLALETWGNDNVSFPSEVYRRYVKELYRDDALAKGTFRLSGRPARLENLECPLLAVTFEHDGIVPWAGAAELVEQAGSRDKRRVHLPGGHVGAVVSKHAAKTLWPELSAFWAARDEKAPLSEGRRAQTRSVGSAALRVL